MDLQWMAWTPVTAGFFIFIVIMLICMTTWEILAPNVARKGFLPIVTTRGDRLFISLLGSAYIHLMWVGLTDQPLHYATGISICWLISIMRWG